MLPAASAKKNADPNLFHDLSVWTRGSVVVKLPAMIFRIPAAKLRMCSTWNIPK
jgi:hypothetical protein